MHAVLGDEEQLAAAELALGLGADQVERAGLGRHRPAVVEFPEDERAEAVRVAEGEELSLGERAHRVRALEAAHRVLDRLLERGRVVRDEGGDQLGVGAGASLTRGLKPAQLAFWSRLPLWPSATRARPCRMIGCAFDHRAEPVVE